MLAVDTNVLVRFLIQDDPKQTARATRLVRDEEVWLSRTVLLETAWVLRSVYGLPGPVAAEALKKLVDLPTISVEDELNVRRALAWAMDGLDVADALHLASAESAGRFATFDRELARRARDQAAIEILTV